MLIIVVPSPERRCFWRLQQKKINSIRIRVIVDQTSAEYQRKFILAGRKTLPFL